jgi:predicted metal-dependent hydrolase
VLNTTTLADLERAIGRPITRQAARGRGMRLYVREGAVTVSVPRAVAEAEIISFIRGQIPWLRKHLLKHDTGRDHGAAQFQLTLSADDHVPVFGVAKTILLDIGGAPFIESAHSLTLLAKPGANQLVTARKQLINALAAIHTQALGQDIRLMSEALGVHARRVTIKPMRTLWGSLGPNNSISVNFALIFAPRECTTYIAAHELAHVLERNHGPRFWAHVKRAFPGFEDVHRYLRKHHSFLMRLQDSVLTI